jgi:hypothetical protein
MVMKYLELPVTGKYVLACLQARQTENDRGLGRRVWRTKKSE